MYPQAGFTVELTYAFTFAGQTAAACKQLRGVTATATASPAASSLRPQGSGGCASNCRDSVAPQNADMKAAIASDQPSLGMESACNLGLYNGTLARATVE